MYARARRGDVVGVLCEGCFVESEREAAAAIERLGRALYLSALRVDRATERSSRPACARCGGTLAGANGDRRGDSAGD
jgi:hypothetical protein